MGWSVAEREKRPLSKVEGPSRRPRRIAVTLAAALLASLLVQYAAVVGPAGASEEVIMVDKASVSVGEGAVAGNSGTFADPGGYATKISANIGTVTQSGEGSGTWTWSYTAPDGPATETVTITASRLDGGRAPESVTFDLAVTNVAPTATLDAPASAKEDGSFVLSLSGAADPGQEDARSLAYAFDCGDGAGYSAPGGADEATCDSLSEPGQQAVGARVMDKDGGSTEYRASVEITDATPPETAVLSGPKKLGNSTSADFRFSSSEPNSTFECGFDGAGFKACDAEDSLVHLSSKAHVLLVRAVDAAGNADPTPAVHEWEVDAIRPTIKALAPKGKAQLGGRAPIVRAVVKDNSALTKQNIRLTVAGKKVPAAKYAYKNNVLTYRAKNLSAGKKLVRIVATDAATNVGTKTWRFNHR